MIDPIELVGERVRVRSLRRSDMARMVAIRSTPEVLARWPSEDVAASVAEELDDGEAVQLAIEDLATDGVVGMIQFGEEDDPQYRHASIDIYVDPAMHRRGFASDAIRTLSDHLFDGRGHHRLTIDPAADNEAAIRCYAKVGFRPVGVMRRYERQGDGSWADGLLMEMLATDRDAGPAQRLPPRFIDAPGLAD